MAAPKNDPQAAPDIVPPYPPYAGQPAPWLTWVVLGVTALIVIGIFKFRPFGTPDPRQHPAVEQSQPLPAVDLVKLTGNGPPSITNAHLAGKVVLINFWATWCGPCRSEFPHIVALHEKFGGRSDFRVLSISCEANQEKPNAPRENPAALLQEDTVAFLGQFEVGDDFPVYGDPQWNTRISFMKAGLFENSLPASILIDRQGVVRSVWPGYRPGMEEEMEALIVELLDGVKPGE